MAYGPFTIPWVAALALATSLAINTAPGLAAGVGQEQVDLQLVLAVDASGSVNDEEYRLQLNGIAQAFMDPEIIEAIGDGPLGRIGVALVVWAESKRSKARTAWHVINSAEDARTFASVVRGFGRSVGGGTGIGKAMVFAVRMIETSGLSSARRTIDISGDGRETTFREWSVPPDQARHAAIDRGITINGLAITSEDQALKSYYASQVIAGPTAFVMTAASIGEFAQAMRVKLLREIQGELIIGSLEQSRSTRK
jgi:hypothetical protein